MKIEIVFSDATRSTIYGVSPLDFAAAILSAADRGELPLQTPATIEAAIASYNERRLVRRYVEGVPA